MRTGGSSGPRAVFNSSPLIVLAKLGLLRQALKLSCEVEIPEVVLEEVSRKRDQAYEELDGLISEGLARVEHVGRALPRLGRGESEAILLALERGKIVVLDGKRARRLSLILI